MAFGDVYGYKTNSRFVAATAESAERTRVIGEEPNPDFDDQSPVDPDTNPETVDVTETVVDLVLLGFANGRRSNTVVSDATTFNTVPTNQAVPAATAEALTGVDSVAPGETTAKNYSTGHHDETGAIA